MASSTTAPSPGQLTREEVVPSRKRIKLPPWLEVAKPRLIPLLLATTLGGMALTEGWPLSSPRLACTLGGGALAAAAAAAPIPPKPGKPEDLTFFTVTPTLLTELVAACFSRSLADIPEAALTVR